MHISLRAALFAGALLTMGSAAWAEPMTVSDALTRGAETSPRIAQARAQVAAAEGRARQAGVSPNPELGLQVENFGGSGPYRNFRQTETTLAISQRLETGAKRAARQRVARAELDFANYAFQRAQADLARDIRYAHAGLRAAEDRAVVARGQAERARELARTAGILVDAGRDPPLRKFRADALVAETEADSARAFGELLAARRLLQTLTGVDDPEIVAVGPDDAAMLPPLEPGVPGVDERLALAERDAAGARIKLAQAQAIPDVTASGGFRRFREGGETAIIAGISIPFPIRDRNRGGIAAARAESVASDAVLAQTRLDTNRLRRDAQVALAAADERLNALSGPGVKQAQEALRIADIGYRSGKFSLIELIDAQNAAYSAELNLIQARFDRARALADLARANAQ